MRSTFLLVILVAISLAPRPVLADDDSALSQRQTGVAERYQRLEELLLRLADVEVAENPERAALLRRAARQSRDKFVLERLRDASESLRNQEFQKAVENQGTASEELNSLLKLLLSEDRSQRIRDEKERYQKLIKDLKRNLNNQRSARARTENGAEFDQVEEEQKAVTRRSEELKAELAKENESAQDPSAADSPAQDPSDSAKPSDTDAGGDEKPAKSDSEPGKEQKSDQEQGSSKESKSGEEQQSDKPSESGQQKESGKQDKPEGGEPRRSDPADSPEQKSGQPMDSQQGAQPEGQPSQQQGQQQQGQQQQGQQQQGQQQQGQQQQGQQQQAQTPEQEVEQQLQQAIEKMRQAEQELEQAEREQATEKQRQAEQNLRAAIDSLEKILRQLREEEMQRELARLEARLRKMAQMQTKVYEDTVTLAATPASQRNRQTDLKAGDLAFEEKKITLEADRAMLLLREEGSSVAFPEVVSQIRSDTTRVAERLAETKIDAVTQGIQKDILAALEEMIAALQKAQRDLEKKRQEQQQGQPQQPGQGEQPLVEALAELKLIRTMETRIKSTTERYSSLLESGESAELEVLPLLQDLSDRQNRLYRITRDLVLKRNQ